VLIALNIIIFAFRVFELSLSIACQSLSRKYYFSLLNGSKEILTEGNLRKVFSFFLCFFISIKIIRG
jgi:hypothetical protein